MGCNPWGPKELDMTEQLSMCTYITWSNSRDLFVCMWTFKCFSTIFWKDDLSSIVLFTYLLKINWPHRWDFHFRLCILIYWVLPSIIQHGQDYCKLYNKIWNQVVWILSPCPSLDNYTSKLQPGFSIQQLK